MVVVIESFPANVPQVRDDRPAAVDRVRPGVVLDVSHAAERKDFAGLKFYLFYKTNCFLQN